MVHLQKWVANWTRVENISFRHSAQLTAANLQTEASLERYPTTSCRFPPYFGGGESQPGAKNAEVGAEVGVHLP